MERNTKVYLQKMIYNLFLMDLIQKSSSKDLFKELGATLEESLIIFSVNAMAKDYPAIMEMFTQTLNNNSDIKAILLIKYQVLVKFNFISKNFTGKEIEGFTFYYYNPRPTINKYVFKYSPVNENLEKLLENNTLWFGAPTDFKDIWDCRSRIDTEPSEINILDFYYAEYLKSQPNPIVDISKFRETFIIPSKEAFNKDLEEHHFSNTFSKMGVTCFTEAFDNKLMWDHYANGYKGVCLIFDTELVENGDTFIFRRSKVKYLKSLPKHFFDASGVLDATQIFFTKLLKYRYENEIREVINFQESGQSRAVKFNPAILKGVIFGPKCADSDKNKVKHAIDKNGELGQLELIDSFINISGQAVQLKNHKLNLKAKLKRLDI